MQSSSNTNAATNITASDDATMLNRSSGQHITMSPTFFRGVMTLDDEEDEEGTITSALPPMPGIESKSSSHSQQQQENGRGGRRRMEALLSSSSSTMDPQATSITSGGVMSSASSAAAAGATSTSTSQTPLSPQPQMVRSRKAKQHRQKTDGISNQQNKRHRHRRKQQHKDLLNGSKSATSGTPSKSSSYYCSSNFFSFFGTSASSSSSSSSVATKCGCDRTLVRSTLSCMNLLARILFWCSAGASVAAVVWYSYELKKHGTDPHLIAWFSAGAFVLLGFPISMYGIVMHLANYNQPNVQNYVVRILWMVPIYSIESWLCLRYKEYAIYIETWRDFYESYVLYSFLQFLIQVLGGEEALILMLKDKSPTRGVHMWGLQWCVKPWLMGQPLRKTFEHVTPSGAAGVATAPSTTTTTPQQQQQQQQHQGDDPTLLPPQTRTLKRVYWTSPFFVQCKFGVLQYVLLKIMLSVIVMVLEHLGLYKEGDFTPKGGYLYICILTNLSQCWALYCLIFFYYATKNELANIRPVGKFLSVKALVFFTWWQSVTISIFYQMDLIPHYHGGTGMGFLIPSRVGNINNNNNGLVLPGSDDDSADDPTSSSSSSTNLFIDPRDSVIMPLTAEEALRLDEFGGSVLASSDFSTSSSSGVSDHHYAEQQQSQSQSQSQQQQQQQQQEWTPEEIAKALQDYLICIEMFVAAIIHIFVFSHTEYDPQAVEARSRALNQTPHKDWNKRLGRKWKEWDNKSGWSGTTNTSRDNDSHNNNTLELASFSNNNHQYPYAQHHHHHPHGATTTTTIPTGSFDEEDDLRIHPLDRLDEQSRGADVDEEDDDDDDDDNDEARERKPLLALEDDDDDGENAEAGGSLQSMESSILHGSSSYFDDDSYEDEDEGDVENPPPMAAALPSTNSSTGAGAANHHKTGFVRALLDSAIPQDLRDNTVGIIKGDYVVEKKTLLHHAATSDSYDLFSRAGLRRPKKPSSMYKSTAHSVD